MHGFHAVAAPLTHDPTPDAGTNTRRPGGVAHRGRLAPTSALALGLSLGCAATAAATIPYTPVGGFTEGFPGLGPGLITPDRTYGKEYSHDRDHTITAAGTAPDPHQVVAWDGIGGVTDGQDYSGVLPTFLLDLDVDALANSNDAFFDQLVDSDESHLLFSLDREAVGYGPGGGGPVPLTIPAGSPPGILLKNGNVVGGAGEVSYELAVFGGANPADSQGLWADQAMVNGMPLPDDLDGLEVWGPEPGVDADADKFSLRADVSAPGPTGGLVSVWNADGSPYISLPTITAAVTSLLGPLPDGLSIEDINLDALMVDDEAGADTDFGREVLDNNDVRLDRILFSIDQIADPADASGYYATGSELMLLDAAGAAAFLVHSGHVWDKAYALSTFTAGEPGQQQYFAFDIDAIETVSEFAVPEPAAAAVLASVGLLASRRRG